MLEPFGQDNLKPLFSICGASVNYLHFMGKDEQHVRFLADNGDGRGVECVLFRRAQEFASLLASGEPVDVAGELSVNEFNGSRRLQFNVRDLRKGRN
jgi:single-stranded-DNA-specific exonuclease